MSPSLAYKSFASVRPFGVEIEVNEKVHRNTMADAIRLVDPHREVLVSGWNMTGGHGLPDWVWSVKTDSTCASVPGLHGNEVASPKLTTNEGIKMVGRVAAALEQIQCEVNNHCGVHIHVDISDWNRDRTGIMPAHWLRLESVMAQSLPPHRRNNPYARFLRKKHHRINYEQKWLPNDLYCALEPSSLEIHQNREKRVAVNLVGYATGLRTPEYGRKTAELRLPEGTLNQSDIENWTRLYVHFIDQCATRDMPESLSLANLQESLAIFGLAGEGTNLAILCPQLFETKVWFLKRILKHTNDLVLFHEIIELLNRLHEPVEKFVETEPA